MRNNRLLLVLLPPFLLALALIATSLSAAAADEWQDKFDVPADHFASSGKTLYFILEPGQQMRYEGEEEDGKKGVLIVTVLEETKKVDGVETRIVEERESADGELAEVSRNYFAIDKPTGDVYYFGEEVDTYKKGKVTGHEGSWEAGKDGAHYGLFMPAKPKVGQRFYQELAPKRAMDRVEILSITETVKVPAGTFENCVKTRETTPLEPDTKEEKVYAPGVGLLIDGGLKLVKHGAATK